MSAGDEPLAGAAFERLMEPFAPFESEPTVAVAVSGGRDSLALAVLAHDWARARGGRIVALVVDHALRPESAAEAVATVAALGGRGIEGAVLRWEGARPRSGIQEAARAARYRLLREECRRRGILHLLLAHHADDQAETVAMRARHGSGPDGLAGMAAVVEHAEVRLLRPLLAVSRTQLTATLRARAMSWIEDPSNADLRFERARLRAAKRPPARPAADREERAGRERLLAAAAVEAVEFLPDGSLAIDRSSLAGMAAPLQAGLLSRAVQAVGGGDHPPRRDRLEQAVMRLYGPPDRGRSGRAGDFTLAACRLQLRLERRERRLRWIVRPEHGRRSVGIGAQSLIPSAFFACGAFPASHLD